MKKSLIVVLMAILGSSPVYASDFVVVDFRIAQMEAQIEAQIERVKRAREEADVRAALAGFRVENQLRLAEERLMAQLERLELYQEQLGGKIGQKDAELRKLRRRLAETLARARERVKSEIARTGKVINKLKRMRDRANSALEEKGNTHRACADTGTAGLGDCSGCPSCTSDESSSGLSEEGSSGAFHPAPPPPPPPPPPRRSGG
jgi:DNA repair exonuclease SbcCD ATPase subunit